MKSNITIKYLLQRNQNWWRFFQCNHHRIRPAIVDNIIKLLSCKNMIRGYHRYCCANPLCSHIKKVPHTCKGRACSSCGKKATECWIQKQLNLLPKTDWQHITFTMPCELWDCFWHNRKLLNVVSQMAYLPIKHIADSKGLIVGAFAALHTFGRDLKRNVHVHLSVTCKGLTRDLTQFKPLFFQQKTLMSMWRYQIIHCFRQAFQTGKLILPKKLSSAIKTKKQFNQFLDTLYKKTWVVHCAKPSDNHKNNVKYLGRYIKRPPIAEAKLKHYDGHSVSFDFLDHRTNTRKKRQCSDEDFIKLFIQHIPDKHFRMIRYYGFLANRVRGKLLPIVHRFTAQQNQQTQPPSWAALLQQTFNFNPLKCILCGDNLILVSIHYGKHVIEMVKHHRQLALMKPCI